MASKSNVSDEVDGRARSCPACGGSLTRSLGSKNSFSVLACRSCRTLFTETLPAEASSEDYDAYYSEENLSVPKFIEGRLAEIVDSFSPYRKTNRLLDIGCGAGSLLKAARNAGWEAEGLEVSRPAVEHVRSEGFKAFHGELEAANYPEGYFDVVTASELLEHVPEPGRLVRDIARILRKGGLWWATTPHANGASGQILKLDWSVISPPEHLHLFSRAALRTLLLNSGFRRVEIKTEGLNPHELLLRVRRTVGNGNSEVVDGSNRVRTGYQLNEALLSSPARRALKNVFNGLLRASHLGDSLKIRAER
jgi:SAM-dependent methyltransferase